MPAAPVGIIGAGLSGLTLGRSLASRGIAATIYEKELRPKKVPQKRSAFYSGANAYAITLHGWAYRPLMAVLELDEAAFRDAVEVLPPPVALKSRKSRILDTSHILNVEVERDTMRCDRGKLLKLLCKGLDTETLGIQWSRVAQKAEALRDGVEVSFDGRGPIKTELLVGADGMRSQMRFSIVPGKRKFRVLPFVVFTGERFVSKLTFQRTYAQFMKESPVIACYHSDTRLEVSADEVHPSEGVIRLRWTYSRRKNAEWKGFTADLNNENETWNQRSLRKELDALKGLKEPFASLFISDRATKDGVICCDVRDTLASNVELQKSPDGRMALIGDAAHVMPLFRGKEHSIAIRDGLDLAEHIAQNPSADMNSFVSRKYTSWKEASLEKERRLFEMHPSVSLVRKIDTGPR